MVSLFYCEDSRAAGVARSVHFGLRGSSCLSNDRPSAPCVPRLFRASRHERALKKKAPQEPKPRKTSDVVGTSRRCKPLFRMYEAASLIGADNWEAVEDAFLLAMSAFDADLAATSKADGGDIKADLQNGKGDFFNDLIALILENRSGIGQLYARQDVPGLILTSHNLDGVYPPVGEIRFLLETKMVGTVKHVGSPKQKEAGRNGSADLGKRVKELAFKSIDLKGEASRRRVVAGAGGVEAGPGGGDLSTWLHSIPPNIYFFVAARVLGDQDFKAVLSWAQTAAQVVDAVGVYCYEPISAKSLTTYRRRPGVPPTFQLSKILYRASLDLSAIKKANDAAI